jgi:hypothetical protein
VRPNYRFRSLGCTGWPDYLKHHAAENYCKETYSITTNFKVYKILRSEMSPGVHNRRTQGGDNLPALRGILQPNYSRKL